MPTEIYVINYYSAIQCKYRTDNSHQLISGINRDRSGLWQKKHLKKAPFHGKKSTFLGKKKEAPISQKKHFWSRKKALSKHYFINKKQQESTYN